MGLRPRHVPECKARSLELGPLVANMLCGLPATRIPGENANPCGSLRTIDRGNKVMATIKGATTAHDLRAGTLQLP